MGWNLQRQVAVGWGHLSGNAYKVLMNMAFTAKDDEGLYYGGWERLAFGMGRYEWPRPDDDSPDAQRLLRSHQRAVEGALTEVVKAGAAVRVVTGGNGRRAVYRLTLAAPIIRFNPVDGGVDDTVDKGRKSGETSKLPHGNWESSPTDSVGQLGSSPTETVGPRKDSSGTKGGTHSSSRERHLREAV